MQLTDEHDESGRRIPVDIPNSGFNVALDTLILAISQHAMLDFLEGERVAVNARGYIDVDPETFETSVPGVYAGGDVANDGPATIVKAAAAGKAIANSILGNAATRSESATACNGAVAAPDLAELLLQRSRRQRRVRAPQTSVDDRQNYREVMLTYSSEQAHVEAARCLQCHRFCSICVGVCPNLALFTYRTDQCEQPYQVAVLADLCNECGNCTTFCPTSGAPYRDKPRLYLDRGEFEAQQDNAFMIFRDGDRWSVDARQHGTTKHLELNGGQENVDELHTAMYTLLKGVQQSMPFLPTCEG
jgi:putative selenate reductase